MVFMIINCINW